MSNQVCPFPSGAFSQEGLCTCLIFARPECCRVATANQPRLKVILDIASNMGVNHVTQTDIILQRVRSVVEINPDEIDRDLISRTEIAIERNNRNIWK